MEGEQEEAGVFDGRDAGLCTLRRWEVREALG